MPLIGRISGFVIGVGTVLCGCLLWATIGGVCYVVGDSLFAWCLEPKQIGQPSNSHVVSMTLIGAMALGLPWALLADKKKNKRARAKQTVSDEREVHE